MVARFSTVAGERGSPDTWRDPRGFALKFYTPDGNFDCIHSTAQTRWIGDPSNPGPGGLFAYLVTATNFDDVETGGGAGRILNTACAAP